MMVVVSSVFNQKKRYPLPMLPSCFDPVIRTWFDSQFDAPTPCQVRAWDALSDDRNVLIAAPTGSGKTLAAFLTAINELVIRAREGRLDSATSVLYVSPLKALSNDIQYNLQAPLQAVRELLAKEPNHLSTITSAVRTGDTTSADREKMRRRPPHILVTTPESLYILLTSVSGRKMLETVKTVIVDEIHAVVSNKRGIHFSLSLARLERLTPKPLSRIGLSATQRPLERIANFLAYGNSPTEPVSACAIVDEGHMRSHDIAIEMPESDLEPVISAEVSNQIRARLIQLILTHNTTLVFVNTRRLTERLAHALTDELGEHQVCAHHGSMSKERRLDAEQRLKRGELKVLVATASLELGIDIGDIDLVCQIGSTRSLAVLLQRIGRAGHAVGGVAKGRLFPQTPDELIECLALLDMIHHRELDNLHVPTGSLDVLAQQIVAEVSCEEYTVKDLECLVKSAWPYKDLPAATLREVIRMLAEGFSFAQGRRSAYLHLDAINDRVRARRGARLAAVTCGGAIPDNADYDVILEPGGDFIGTVNEDFAIESLPGNIFQLGNASWRVLRVESTALRVADAAGQPPNMPFWFGEAPPRTTELSYAVARLRESAQKILKAQNATTTCLVKYFLQIRGVGPQAARQTSAYLTNAFEALGALPSQKTLIAERFFDESGGMQLVIHSPFGGRINRAWGLALRKRFCRTFNFELQAAAIEDAIVISLGAVHSFPLKEVWSYLNAATVRELLVQAILDIPMFTIRWRWVASCALAILRFRSGLKVPPRLQRMNADDLISVVFPDQLACAENLNRNREIPEHPLVAQTINDCLTEAMDIDGLECLLADIAAGDKILLAMDLTGPSPLALEVLNANPYAFLDDAPLEERRTRAVNSRSWSNHSAVGDLGKLDASAIQRVKNEIQPNVRSEDELHEAVLLFGFVPNDEIPSLSRKNSETGSDWVFGALTKLHKEGRLLRVSTPVAGWAPAERAHEIRTLWPNAEVTRTERGYKEQDPPDLESALSSLIRSRLEMSGPVTVGELSALFGITTSRTEQILLMLENAGIILRGSFQPDVEDEQWCDRRLLARIHRYTIARLRREIEAVSVSTFIRFLFEWQHVTPGRRLQGLEGLYEVIGQLSGFEAPAGAWESDLLPLRVAQYQEVDLDQLVGAGRCSWLRLHPKITTAARTAGTLKITPIVIMPRQDVNAWLRSVETGTLTKPTGPARIVWEYIIKQGASFFDDIVINNKMLKIEIENSLDELAALGLVTCDSFRGLRALIAPRTKRRRGYRRIRRGLSVPKVNDTGRWDRVRRPETAAKGGVSELSESDLEIIALSLLRRYGVVFRDLLEREPGLPPWRTLLQMFRQLESSGKIQGGRFVASVSGEQFALSEAIVELRTTRKRPCTGQIIAVSAADPLNLVGLILPGVRVPATTGNRIVYRDGNIVAVRLAEEIRFIGDLATADKLRIQTSLLKPKVSELASSQRRRR